MTISVQPTIIHEADQLPDKNNSELSKQLARIYSRNNLAVTRRSYTTNQTLAVDDTCVIGDTTSGSVTITLAYANSWGSNKTPMITVLRASASNTLTIAPQGSDTLQYWRGNVLVTGNITATGVVYLVTDGTSKWYSLNGDGTTCAFGTYTPSITNSTNVAASTARVCQYLRVGNVVHVSGSVNIDPTSASTNTIFAVSLPIASNLASAWQGAGMAGTSITTANSLLGVMVGDTANDRMSCNYFPSSALAQEVYFHFTYLIV
jgi:hypothetical protein